MNLKYLIIVLMSIIVSTHIKGITPTPKQQADLDKFFWGVGGEKHKCSRCDLSVGTRPDGDLNGPIGPRGDYRDPKADLSYANLTEAHFENSAFNAANLNHVVAKGAHFQGCDFSGADLSDADLSNADLRGANFDNATINNKTNFTGANVEGIQRSSCVIVTNPTFKNAVGSAPIIDNYMRTTSCF